MEENVSVRLSFSITSRFPLSFSTRLKPGGGGDMGEWDELTRRGIPLCFVMMEITLMG